VRALTAEARALSPQQEKDIATRTRARARVFMERLRLIECHVVERGGI
jgi:hypothetical protein